MPSASAPPTSRRPPSGSAHAENLRRAPYIDAYLPPGPERDRCLSRAARWPSPATTRPVEAELEGFDPDVARAAEAAIADDRSQVPALYGTPSRYRSLTRAHAQRLGHDAPLVERYWRGVSPPRPA